MSNNTITIYNNCSQSEPAAPVVATSTSNGEVEDYLVGAIRALIVSVSDLNVVGLNTQILESVLDALDAGILHDAPRVKNQLDAFINHVNGSNKLTSSQKTALLAEAQIICDVIDTGVLPELQTPPLLVPGSGAPFRFVFVTSTTRDATSSVIADYDAHVQAAVAAEGLKYKGTLLTGMRAICSTPTVSAISRLNDTAPLFRFDGRQVAANSQLDQGGSLWQTFTSNQILMSNVNFTEKLSTTIGPVWTGTRTSGQSQGRTLGNGTFDPMAGNQDSRFSSWISNAPRSASLSYPLYGVSPVFYA